MNDRLLLRGIPGRRTSIQYATFDTIHLADAHPQRACLGPSSFAAKNCQALQIAGIPLGLFSEATYDEPLFQLEPGDSLL
jgi:hypothetical protein